MRLRNKKTGEILRLGSFIVQNPNHINCENITKYDSLAELNEEWEDYQETKEFWFIDYDGGIIPFNRNKETATDKLMKSIGNYFETEEEAKKAVEKLKAITRLNKCGFKFEGYVDRDRANGGDIVIYAHIDIPNNNLLEEAQPAMLKDLDLLFGGEK